MWSDRWTGGHANRHQTYRRTEIFKQIGLNTKGRMITQTNGQSIYMHASAVHSRTHTYTLENKHRSRKLGVRNKDYHGHAYMHQT